MKIRISHYFYLFSFIFFGFSPPSFAQNQSKKYIVHGVLNLEGDLNHGISAMNKMIRAGCNAVALTIVWDRIYPKPDTKGNWAQVDNQINYVVNTLKVPIILRIHLGRHISLTNGFWAPDEAVADFKGKPLTYYYDNNHFSFAHQPSIEKAAAFVTEVSQRYKNLQSSGKILFMSVVNTPQQEIGYAYENQQFPGPTYPAIFDHSEWSMIKWRDWTKAKYQTIRTLNSYWGTNYRDFIEVQPYVNWYNTKDSFRGLRGKDWYLFRHILLKNYIDRITAAIKSVDSTYQVSCEFGGVVDNLSLLRGTYAFKDLTEKVDIIKTAIDAFQDESMQGDMIVSNLRPGLKFYTEVAHFDLPTPETLRNYVDRSAEYGCDIIVLYADYDNGKDVEKILPAVSEGVYWLDKTAPPLVFADSLKFRLSQLIDNREAHVLEWKRLSENGKKKIKIIYDEDLIHEKRVIDNPLPDLPDPDPVTPPDPPKPPLQEGPNEPPVKNFTEYTIQSVIDQPFSIRLPENLFSDPDGYIAYIEVLNPPNWLFFNKFEFSFYGRSTTLGKVPITLSVYDNKGANIEATLYFETIPPSIDFELIKADYFDVPLEGWGALTDKRTLYLEHLPEKMNVLARCNLDSVVFRFELDGPYKFRGLSERLPFNLFGEGRGIRFPVGTYSLTAGAYKKDMLITKKTIHFFVKYSTDSTKNILGDWVVYPNPFEKICNIKLPDEEDYTQLNFVLYTSAGKRIHIRKEQIRIENNVAYLDFETAHIMAGSYILEISKSGKILERVRVIKI